MCRLEFAPIIENKMWDRDRLVSSVMSNTEDADLLRKKVDQWCDNTSELWELQKTKTSTDQWQFVAESILPIAMDVYERKKSLPHNSS